LVKIKAFEIIIKQKLLSEKLDLQKDIAEHEKED